MPKRLRLELEKVLFKGIGKREDLIKKEGVRGELRGTEGRWVRLDETAIVGLGKLAFSTALILGQSTTFFLGSLSEFLRAYCWFRFAH